MCVCVANTTKTILEMSLAPCGAGSVAGGPQFMNNYVVLNFVSNAAKEYTTDCLISFGGSVVLEPSRADAVKMGGG